MPRPKFLSSSPILRIGSRGSALALKQTEFVRAQLARLHDIHPDRLPITLFSTTGDRSQSQNQPLRNIGGNGLFTREIEQALLDNEIDLAVHSAKDLATEQPAGLVMDIFPPREDVADAFVSLKYKTVDSLPRGATVGTSSIRRRAQLLHLRPDLKIINFRGNVDTRLTKLQQGQADATILAVAGLNRLAMSDYISQRLSPR